MWSAVALKHWFLHYKEYNRWLRWEIPWMLYRMRWKRMRRPTIKTDPWTPDLVLAMSWTLGSVKKWVQLCLDMSIACLEMFRNVTLWLDLWARKPQSESSGVISSDVSLPSGEVAKCVFYGLWVCCCHFSRTFCYSLHYNHIFSSLGHFFSPFFFFFTPCTYISHALFVILSINVVIF